MSHKEVVTHKIWKGFDMELLLSRVYPETIMNIGRCSSNAFLRYIWIQFSYLSKFIGDLMVGEEVLYTITKAEVIYYTPGKYIEQTCRLKT